MNVLKKLERYRSQGLIPEKYAPILHHFYTTYAKATRETEILNTHLELVKKQCIDPFHFEKFHPCIKEPFDYYQFGIDFIKPLIDISHSSISDIQTIDKIVEELQKKENVILFANHQTETDPQILSILLEKYPTLAEEIIFVAGNRVTTDPLAVPFSLGRNLLCIHSKKYIEGDNKSEKQMHNKRTMTVMRKMLSSGGKCILVFPNGGRDRVNKQEKLEVAPFDPSSIAMFRLMAKHSKALTHFYPVTFVTYKIVPPPSKTKKELGEERIVERTGVHIHFGPELNMEYNTELSKHEQRDVLTKTIFEKVKSKHDELVK